MRQLGKVWTGLCVHPLEPMRIMLPAVVVRAGRRLAEARFQSSGHLATPVAARVAAEAIVFVDIKATTATCYVTISRVRPASQPKDMRKKKVAETCYAGMRRVAPASKSSKAALAAEAAMAVVGAGSPLAKVPALAWLTASRGVLRRATRTAGLPQVRAGRTDLHFQVQTSPSLRIQGADANSAAASLQRMLFPGGMSPGSTIGLSAAMIVVHRLVPKQI